VAYAYRVKVIREVSPPVPNVFSEVRGGKIQKGIKYYKVPFIDRKKTGN
jgi:hypothetical protein